MFLSCNHVNNIIFNLVFQIILKQSIKKTTKNIEMQICCKLLKHHLNTKILKIFLEHLDYT